MKEIIGKPRNINNSLRRQFIINDIAGHFNRYFVNVGPNLTAQIPQT